MHLQWKMDEKLSSDLIDLKPIWLKRSLYGVIWPLSGFRQTQVGVVSSEEGWIRNLAPSVSLWLWLCDWMEVIKI